DGSLRQGHPGLAEVGRVLRLGAQGAGLPARVPARRVRRVAPAAADGHRAVQHGRARFQQRGALMRKLIAALLLLSVACAHAPRRSPALDAAAERRRLLELPPAILHKEARELMARGDWEAARLRLELYLAQAPDNAAAHFDAGWVAERLLDPKSAADLYSRALARDPAHVGAALNLARLQRNSQRRGRTWAPSPSGIATTPPRSKPTSARRRSTRRAGRSIWRAPGRWKASASREKRAPSTRRCSPSTRTRTTRSMARRWR